jgi:hypothetical protein
MPLMRGIMAEWQASLTSVPSLLRPCRELAEDVHRSCGQLCGKGICILQKTASWRAFHKLAVIWSRVFRMQIKGLRVHDKCVTAGATRGAAVGAAVEFMSRASHGFWRG